MKLTGTFRVVVPAIGNGEAEVYEWCPDDMSLGDWHMLQTELGGMHFEQWTVALDERDAIPCQVLVWYLRRKAGRDEDRMSVDFPVLKLDFTKLRPPAASPDLVAAADGAQLPEA